MDEGKKDGDLDQDNLKKENLKNEESPRDRRKRKRMRQNGLSILIVAFIFGLLFFLSIGYENSTQISLNFKNKKSNMKNGFSLKSKKESKKLADKDDKDKEAEEKTREGSEVEDIEKDGNLEEELRKTKANEGIKRVREYKRILIGIEDMEEIGDMMVTECTLVNHMGVPISNVIANAYFLDEKRKKVDEDKVLVTRGERILEDRVVYFTVSTTKDEAIESVAVVVEYEKEEK